MYIDNENFEKWMEKLSKKLTEIGQDLKSLINTDTVFDENEKLLDNQDLAFLLKASFRTLQRYRAKGVLPYFNIGRKTYYRASDIRAFVREYADSQAYKQFEKVNQLENQPTEAYVRTIPLCYHPDLAETASPIGSARFAKSSKRELDKSCSSLLPCGAKPSAIACYKNML